MTAFVWLIYHNTNVDTDEYFMSNKDCTSCPGNKKSLYPGRGGLQVPEAFYYLIIYCKDNNRVTTFN